MIKEFLKFIFTNELISSDVEHYGQGCYKTGKRFMFFGACGLIILILISLIVITTYSSYTLFNYVLLLNTLSGSDLLDFFVNALVLLSYIGIFLGIIGIPIYFYGINLFALGRIAHNTEKE